MNFLLLVSCFLSLIPTQIDAQQPPPQTCSSPIYVGNNNIATTTIPDQGGHGAQQSVIVYDSTFTIPCTCGLLVGWELIKYDNTTDGCKAYPCYATIMVYRNLNMNAMTATLVGYYNETNINKMTLAVPGEAYIRINIPQANFITVKYGDNLGWEGSPSPVTYYEESPCPTVGACPSGLPSTSKFFYGSNKAPLPSQIAFYDGPANNYSYWRYFGFRAIVWAGTAPYFTSIIKTLTVSDSLAVGTVIQTVKAADNETLQNLNLSVIWSCPLTSYFNLDPVTGDITLIRSLVGAPILHTLTVEVSDGCFNTDADININVIQTLTTTAPPTTPSTTPELLATPVGSSLLAITILASLVAIGSSIGMCCIGAQMSNITKELGEIPPMRDQLANNQRNPKTNINQKRKNLTNRKPPQSNMNIDSPRSKTGIPRNGSQRQDNSWKSATHGSPYSSETHLTPVEQFSGASPSPRATPRSYPPRDMLYW